MFTARSLRGSCTDETLELAFERYRSGEIAVWTDQTRCRFWVRTEDPELEGSFNLRLTKCVCSCDETNYCEHIIAAALIVLFGINKDIGALRKVSRDATAGFDWPEVSSQIRRLESA